MHPAFSSFWEQLQRTVIFTHTKYLIVFIDQQQYYEDNLPSPPHPPVYSSAYDTTASDNIPSYDSSPHDLSREFDDSPLPELHHRSKSEALLETNFDFENESSPVPLSEASRSHSQPLETAM